MSSSEKIFVPVPKEYMGIVIGTGGTNIKQLKQETHTGITSCNGDNFEKESGFTVTGTATGCEEARLAIQHRIDNASVTIKEPVPQQFLRLLTGKYSSDNFRGIEKECGVRITWPKFSGTEEHVHFNIKGSRSNCERAREMLRGNIKKWQDNEVCRKPVSPVALGSQTHSKVAGDVRKIVVPVPKEYISFVVGKERKNIEKIETNSGTKIKVPFRRNAKAKAKGRDAIRLEITGPPKNCVRAHWLIRHCVIAYKDKIANKDIRDGNTQFVCFDFKDENENFELNPGGNGPKLDGFIQGQRYRIKTETDDDSQSEISDKTMSEIRKRLLTSLENLNKLKDKKNLIIDLWCHFGKVFVSGVDEEEAKKIMTPADISGRLKTISSGTLKNKDTTAYWKVSFEEGVDPLDDTALPNFGDENHEFFGLKLVHTQWRYDFGFITPSYRIVRLKAWEGLPPDSDEKPPVGVKYILTPVSLKAEEGIKAWICYPSKTVLRGEIMTPNSEYDCRMKLRAGSRYVTDKDNVCIEEDAILSEYLSNCKFDNANHSMDLPDEKDHEMPEGFGCMYYREAKEKMFSATVDGECFTVIVLDEKGWDSDLSDKRDQNQFGIRVVMDSWSEALLSPERNWKPEEIVDKLNGYMEFLSLLKNEFFDG